MNSETALAGGLALLGTKELIGKLLGPTADYLGETLRDYTKKGHENLHHIFAIALKNLGDRVEEPGAIPPKVLRLVLNEGYTCEDSLAAEYFGGVLASSRTPTGRDDRAATLIQLLSRMSTYQIRAHYLFYQAVRTEFKGARLDVGISSDRALLCMFAPHLSLYKSMDFGPGEKQDTLIPHVMNGLANESLIEDHWYSGDPINIRDALHFQVPDHGLVWTPSALGFELFMGAHGVADKPINDFLRTKFDPLPEITPLTGLVRKENDIKSKQVIRPFGTNGSMPPPARFG